MMMTTGAAPRVARRHLPVSVNSIEYGLSILFFTEH